MFLRRILLWPFTLFYGAILLVRHSLYDGGLLESTRPTLPTIAIGNLALGGTGKTPMMELVLRSLEHLAPVATLSRGYGRRTTTIHEVMPDDDAARSGDEPLQVKRNFPAVRVFVGADRVLAIGVIQQAVPSVKAVVLDDALQHRALDAGLNILLTTFQQPFCDDTLLPAGTLRDLRSRAKGAQVVVVTKCPALPSAGEQLRWRERLGLLEGQQLFFSGISYDPPRSVGRPNLGSARDMSTYLPDRQALQEFRGELDALAGTQVLLITGIADPAPLLAHVKGLFATVEHAAFADHHPFSTSDLQLLAARYAKFAPGPQMLVTTEKDAVRLMPMIEGSPLQGFAFAVIPMRTVILNEPERFAALIRDHVATHPAHR